MAEARQKISAYRSALNKHHQVLCEQNGGVHVLPRKAVEKYAVKKLKATQHTCNLDAGNVTFQIGRGDGFVRERLVSTLIQINRVEVVQPLRKYTTSIGLRANYRVEDDPILRYTAITRPSSGDGGEDAMKKYALRVGNVADEEVMEYVLRLVVGRLGDSEQVFQALKSELDFSQAYTTYSELKKLHDSRLRATARLEQIDKLNRNGVQALDPDVATIVNLMEQSSLSTSSRAKVLSRRLQPPIGNLESSLLDSLLDGATAGMAALGLRATDNYADLVDVFCGSFCRMCYRYACHEHGGDHPLPARRVDPMYPRFRSAVSDAQNTGRGNEISSLDLLEDEVVCLGTDPNDVVESAKGVTVQSNAQWGRPNVATVQSSSGPNSDVEMSDSCERQQRKRKLLADPTEFTDDSHVSLVTTKMKLFLSKGTACSKMCWKNSDRTETSDQRAPLLAAELGVVRKLRRTMGDNSCLLAAVVGSASCKDLHELIKKEQASDERTMADGRSSRRTRNWKHGCRSGGSNHELLQRTRNQRLQDRGTENHEYKPCMHEGMCDSTGCSCMKRDHMCEKACACSRDCPNRWVLRSSSAIVPFRKIDVFEGCNCPLSDCRTSKCPCFAALRECDPDVCLSCGASELAADLASGAIVNGAHAQAPSTCGNVNVIRSKHKRLGMSFSSIHGYGMYAREPITANEFVYEYAGAMLSQDEAERRGLIYDKMEMSYLFDLNEDAVLDALRSGNKSKFINHDGETPNCAAKVMSVCGVHHISIWALRDITVGEELVFDYGYKRSVGPDWSQRRTASKDTS
ncbi:Transcriptional repressor EZH1 [Phytophthora cinnamomi]|uniref:Transcriptional repressor EZH1 n=1 Tax=Phytophthora cinnamomi TaxID=4785 RepID=UPI003559DD36|nr:Transcriptional repressor EZH1 [Phytophthora cinnamomi]